MKKAEPAGRAEKNVHEEHLSRSWGGSFGRRPLEPTGSFETKPKGKREAWRDRRDTGNATEERKKKVWPGVMYWTQVARWRSVS